MRLVSKWLCLKPVLKRLEKEADEEIEHQWSNIAILIGGFLIGLVFLVSL